MSKKDELPAPAAAGTDIFAQKMPAEHWAKKHKTEDWLFAAAKVGAFKNVEGFEVTEAGYLSALQHTLNTPLGYSSMGVGVVRGKHATVDPCNPAAVARFEADHVRKAGGK